MPAAPAIGPSANSTSRHSSDGTRTKPRPILGRIHLRRQATLRISIRQLLPVCRQLGGYRIKARRGSTALHFPRHIGDTTLGIGVYDARVRLGKGEPVLHVVKRIEADKHGVLHSAPVHERVGCVKELAALPLATAPPFETAQPQSEPQRLHVKSASDRGVVREAAPAAGGPRTSAFRAAGSPLGAIVIAAVLLSLALFLVASVPADVYAASPAAAIARRRGAIALTGAAAIGIAIGIVIYSTLA